MSAPFKLGEIVDVAIKGVRFITERDDQTVVINCRDGQVNGRWVMPPQAAVTRVTPGGPPQLTLADAYERTSKALAVLDGMESEGYIEPFVAASVRKALDLPPRHWPPQPGDVWDDGFPFGRSLWFARVAPSSGIVMVSTDARDDLSPDDLLKAAVEPCLAYRKAGRE